MLASMEVEEEVFLFMALMELSWETMVRVQKKVMELVMVQEAQEHPKELQFSRSAWSESKIILNNDFLMFDIDWK